MQLAYAIPLSEDARAFANNLCQAIFKECGVNGALVFPPHITLKLPFEAETPAPFERILHDLASELHPFDLHIYGIALWDEGIIFLDVVPDPRLTAARLRLVETCRALGVEPQPIEDDRYHFHVTVGSGLSPAALGQAWASLKDTPVDLYTHFDKLVLVGNPGDGWRVWRTARLEHSRQD